MSTIPPRALLSALLGRKDDAQSERALAQAVADRREHPARASERLGKPQMARPEGPLVWFHVSTEVSALDLPHLIDRLHAERPEVVFLITTAAYDPAHPLSARMPQNCLHQYLPYETGPGMARFLDHWRPDACLWADPDLSAPILEQVDDAGVPMFMVNATLADERFARLRWFPGATRATLRRFRHVLAVDGRSAANLVRLGLPNDMIEVTGYLQEGKPPLPCHEAERDTLSALLTARPVWLAAEPGEDEIDKVITAHQRAARRSHRLLLILVPADPDSGEALAERLERRGWITALRSTGEEPDRDIQIYVADQSGEMGLWYRLAPVVFMGQTLGEGQGRDPFEATALGSAVLHGPRMRKHAYSYARLHAAGAARQIWGADELANELTHLLAPDKAAEMARAAWEVSTSGAEVTDRFSALIYGVLDEKGL